MKMEPFMAILEDLECKISSSPNHGGQIFKGQGGKEREWGREGE